MRFLVLLRSRCHIIRRLIKVKRCRKETFLISMYFRPDTIYGEQDEKIEEHGFVQLVRD
jgi:hypothetical protein